MRFVRWVVRNSMAEMVLWYWVCRVSAERVNCWRRESAFSNEGKSVSGRESRLWRESALMVFDAAAML